MPHDAERGRSVRDELIVDRAAETPSRVIAEVGDGRPLVDQPLGGNTDKGGAELHIEDAPADADMLPPPSAHRADTMVRAVGADARHEMERGGTFGNMASFTKGANAPTMDQSRLPYTVEDMDEILTEAPRAIFPDAPGGDGATPLSASRTDFLATMGDRGHFPSRKETERWAKAVFNAVRQCAVEHDDALTAEFAEVVRFGEAPEVQVEEMMWGGDYLGRLSRALRLVGNCSKQEFYQEVADQAGETVDDPWVDAAVHSYLGTLKSFLDDDDAESITNLGELQEVWNSV